MYVGATTAISSYKTPHIFTTNYFEKCFVKILTIQEYKTGNGGAEIERRKNTGVWI